jgi:hypothetical protein
MAPVSAAMPVVACVMVLVVVVLVAVFPVLVLVVFFVPLVSNLDNVGRL